ncbi:PA2778 family cysteine peptidase [Aquisalimonas asiatica]|uniref:Peptidase_C39 like family protein n=1 Tax=Aquisalimonas asiatica TaxID=406100 RepID=A0A1H8RQ62_9GAMM|nr:PA2778 family cysteine peptidase [Aquisalimonas asiatica]SEO68482.1 Peptidase_C39 like family protein [Aquisalimonas asiatica]
MKTVRRLLLTGALIVLTGCAGSPAPQHAELDESRVDTASERELTHVPFHPQDAYQCGPAALATVMNVAGVDVDADTLKPQVYLPDRRGTLQPELVAATRRYGLLGHAGEHSFADLLQEVDAGNPVLVLQNLGLNRFPIWHYAVVIGFDRDAETVILRSGTTEREVLSFDRFEDTWRRGDYWAMTVHAPGERPATADEASYLRAASALEARKPDAARDAYAAAAEHWPASPVPHVGLGNIAYGAERFDAAAAHYRDAIDRAPDAPAPHHNLAWSLLRLEQHEEALHHARRAAALADTGQSQYFGALEALVGR